MSCENRGISDAETYQSVQEILDILAKGGDSDYNNGNNDERNDYPTSRTSASNEGSCAVPFFSDESVFVPSDQILVSRVTQKAFSNSNSYPDYAEHTGFKEALKTPFSKSSLSLTTQRLPKSSVIRLLPPRSPYTPPTHSLNASSLGITKRSKNIQPCVRPTVSRIPTDIVAQRRSTEKSPKDVDKITTVFIPNPNTIQQGLQQTFNMTSFQPISENLPQKNFQRHEQNVDSPKLEVVKDTVCVKLDTSQSDGKPERNRQQFSKAGKKTPALKQSKVMDIHFGDIELEPCCREPKSESFQDFQSPLPFACLSSEEVPYTSKQQKKIMDETLTECWEVLKHQWQQYLNMSEREMHLYEYHNAKQMCCREVVEMVQDKSRYVWQLVEQIGMSAKSTNEKLPLEN